MFHKHAVTSCARGLPGSKMSSCRRGIQWWWTAQAQKWPNAKTIAKKSAILSVQLLSFREAAFAQYCKGPSDTLVRRLDGSAKCASFISYTRSPGCMTVDSPRRLCSPQLVSLLNVHPTLVVVSIHPRSQSLALGSRGLPDRSCLSSLHNIYYN